MATAIWPLENGQKTITKKHPDRFRIFCLLSLLFDRYHTFSLIFALLRLSVSDRFWSSFFAFFAPFACCHLAAATWTPLILNCVNRATNMDKTDLCNSPLLACLAH